MRQQFRNDEEDAENNRPSTSYSEIKSLRRKHASNNEIDKDTNQDSRFQASEMYELRQPSIPFGDVNETLDDTNIINENRQEAEYHTWKTGRKATWQNYKNTTAESSSNTETN